MKKGDKRGQFYLIAAMIVILILVTLTIILNYSEKRSDFKIEKLGEELKIEGGKVIDYDTYTQANSFEDFAKKFSAYAGANTEIYYIVGREGSIEAYKFEGDSKITKEVTEDDVNNKILITIDFVDYMFDLQPGENFYYIISQEISGETHVVTN